jgi:poly(3-hydroxybutyrate) depolymerase
MRVRPVLLAVAATTLIGAQLWAAGPKVLTHKFAVAGRTRTYSLYVPAPPADGLPPLLVVLHGTGDNAQLMVERWKPLAAKAHVIVAGLDATNRMGWQPALDGPDVLHALVADVASTTPFDDRRIYLFGHSGGASYTIMLALSESRYFAAAVAHAGMLTGPKVQPLIDQVQRKIPIELIAGMDDELVPIELVQATTTQLDHAGLPVSLFEMPNHTHDYEAEADAINAEAWRFLSGVRLDDEPQFVSYLPALR